MRKLSSIFTLPGTQAPNQHSGKDDTNNDTVKGFEIDGVDPLDKNTKVEASSVEINTAKKSPLPKMKNLPQIMKLSDSKLKRTGLMTRRESQALLEGVRKNRGAQNSQSNKY